jgi:hypothetical protein
VAHLYFLQPHKAKQKNPKEPPRQRNYGQTQHAEKNNQPLTAPKKIGGSVLRMTVLWFNKHLW